jgi:predicted nucleotidyltransferase
MDLWRELLEERLEEAVAALGSVPGVRGLVVGGSIGRGEPWPMSDIDMLPITAAGAEPGPEVERRRAALVDWWAASGRAQTLDVGWLSFTDEEVERAVRSGPVDAAEKMSDRRWLHGVDKAFGGRGGADADGLAGAFAAWATRVRFEPTVVAARVREWTRQAVEARDGAMESAGRGDRARATMGMRQAARALRMVLIEGWGTRYTPPSRALGRLGGRARPVSGDEVGRTRSSAGPDLLVRRYVRALTVRLRLRSGSICILRRNVRFRCPVDKPVLLLRRR